MTRQGNALSFHDDHSTTPWRQGVRSGSGAPSLDAAIRAFDVLPDRIPAATLPKMFKETNYHRPVIQFDEQIVGTSGRWIAAHAYVQCACGQRFVVDSFGERAFAADERDDACEHFGYADRRSLNFLNFEHCVPHRPDQRRVVSWG